MTDRHDKREQPEGNHFKLCQRIAELEGVAGQLEIDPEKLPEEVQNSRAVQAALKRLQNQTNSAQIQGPRNSPRSEPAPEKAKNFQDAVEIARKKLTSGA